jgi:hypothetical protein
VTRTADTFQATEGAIPQPLAALPEVHRPQFPCNIQEASPENRALFGALA